MSLLTDTDIREYLEGNEHPLKIEPYSEDSLTPVGYDLRAGGKYATSDEGVLIDPFREGMKLSLYPGQTALVSTLEKISMPKDGSISALIVSKVSKVSKGLSHISTTIDPDWSGSLIIAITNHSSNKIEIEHGEPLCTAVFFINKSLPQKSCEKSGGRPDIFVREWTTISKKIINDRKAERSNLFKKFLISPLIIIVGFIIGYIFFGPSKPIIIAIVGMSVAISQLYNTYLTYSYKQ